MENNVINCLTRYMDQVMELKFTREAHVKKYNKLMKFNLPAELESLRWVDGLMSYSLFSV